MTADAQPARLRPPSTASRAHATGGDAAPSTAAITPGSSSEARASPCCSPSTTPRAPSCTLFRPAEDARGYFLLMERCCALRHPARPLQRSHAVFRASAQQRAGGEASTQVARALAELGVRLIFARSPQAKGRVERMAGVPGPPRDRTAPRLGHHHRRAQAVIERFLPLPASRSRPSSPAGLAAARPGTRPRGHPRFRHTRSVARDNTVKYHWRTLQLLPSAQPQLRRRARRGAGAPRRRTPVRHQGETTPPGSPPRSGVLRERRSELALDPALVRVRASAPVAVHPARRRTRLRPTARSSTPLRPPSCLADREAGGALEVARRRDSRCSPAARHLTQHHQEVRPRRRPTRVPGCGIIYHQRPAKRTFSLNR